jgi:hypothetical protein
MFTATYALITLLIFVAAVSAVSVVVSRGTVAEPALASPFGRVVPSADPAADTLEGGVAYKVYPAAKPGEWQILTCDSLRDVEDALDNLENNGILEHDVVALANNCFAVRWKC